MPSLCLDATEYLMSRAKMNVSATVPANIYKTVHMDHHRFVMGADISTKSSDFHYII